jgi:hypothetical protein
VQLIDVHLFFHLSQINLELYQFFKDDRGECWLFEVLEVLRLHLSRCIGLHVSGEAAHINDRSLRGVIKEGGMRWGQGKCYC